MAPTAGWHGLPAGARTIVDAHRFGGLSALETTRRVYGAQQRTVLTHSPTLHQAQARGFDQTLAKAEAKLTTLADTLARGKTRRTRPKVAAEIDQILANTWARRVTAWELTGEPPAQHRRTWPRKTTARRDLEEDVFGTRQLITSRPDWSHPHVLAA